MNNMEANVVELPKLNIRHDWYQTEQYVVVTILVKNAKHEDLTITFTNTHLKVELKLPDDQKYTLDLDLAHEINTEKCSYKLMTTKIEIKLMKSEGIQWSSLERNPNEVALKSIPLDSSSTSGPPRYPTSNPLHRDWDAIEKDILKELAQDKPQGEDGVNNLFQKIYGEGSDEVKKAMNKSYLESGGTVLSTNWGEISKDKVPIKPPDGMEWKQWNN